MIVDRQHSPSRHKYGGKGKSKKDMKKLYNIDMNSSAELSARGMMKSNSANKQLPYIEYTRGNKRVMSSYIGEKQNKVIFIQFEL